MLGVIDSSFSFAIGKFGDRLTAAREKNERGFVLVFCSITMLVVTAVGGFAVDIGNWYSKAGKLQAAADAAALAGATYLPGDVDGAIAAARSSLEQNGFGNALVNADNGGVHGGTGDKKRTPTVFIAQDPGKPTRLRVEVGSTYDNYFTSLLGYNQQTLVRESTAFWRMEIPVGSPGVVLGAEPAGLGPSVQPTIANNYNGQYWLNIAGGQSDKANGDKYTANVCKSSTATDGCDGTKNEDIVSEDSRSHQYIVHVPAGVTGPIRLQVFDGAFVDVGNTCDTFDKDPNRGINLNAADMNGLESQLGKPAGLYDSGTGKYCTGDAAMSLLQTPTAKPAPTLSLTTYDVTGDGEMNLKAMNKVADTTTYPAVNVQDPQSLATQLKDNEALRDSFRQWNTFATINPIDTMISHDYIIEARTPANSYGNNHYSLRVGIGNEGAWNTVAAKKISLSAKGHLTIYTNADSNSSKSFYFAKLTNSQAGRTVDLNLFDVGDGAAPLDVQLIAPANASGLSAGFGSCQQLGPTDDVTITRPICKITGASGNGTPSYNGRNVTLRFTIPSTYRCNDDGAAGCWMGLKFITTDAVYDTTTWEVLDCGKPLRLVQPNQPDVFSACPSPSGAVGTTLPPEPSTTTSTTVKQNTTTTKKPATTSTTKKPTTSTTKKPTTTTSKPGNTTSTTQKPSTTTTKKPTTTTSKPNTTTTKKPAQTTTTWVGGT